MPEKRHHERMSTRNSPEKKAPTVCVQVNRIPHLSVLCLHCIQVIAFEWTFTIVFYNIFMVILHSSLKKRRRKRKEVLSTSPVANYDVRYKNHSYMND